MDYATEMSYDLLGQLVSTTDAEGVTVTYEYDHMGRMTKVSDPVGDTDYGYNSAGNLASVTDGNNNRYTVTAVISPISGLLGVSAP